MLRRVLVLTVVCLLFALPAFAQEVVDGEITADSPTVDFDIDLEAGSSVIIIAQAVDSGLDPMLFLYDPSDALETVSDGLGDGDGIAFMMHEAEASGTYRVRVRGYSASIGDFRIAIESVADAEPALIGDATLYSDLPQSRAEDGAFVLGDPDAPVTLVEFADFVCPHCISYHSIVDQFILDFVVTGQANFEYRVFPTAGGQLSAFTGALAECAENAQPGAFWEAYALLYDYAEAGQYNNLVGYRLIQALNLNLDEMNACLSTVSQWRTDIAFGQTQGVSGTPALMIRYGDGEPEWITYDGTTYDQGAASYEIVAAVIEAAQGE